MFPQKILIIDNDRRAKVILKNIIKRHFNEYEIELVTKRIKLNIFLRNVNYNIVLVNTDLKWGDPFKVLEFLTKNYPFLGRIAFNFSQIELIRDGKRIKVDALIQNFGEVKQIVYAIDFAYEKAFERKELSLATTEYSELFDNVPIGLYRTYPTGRIMIIISVISLGIAPFSSAEILTI